MKLLEWLAAYLQKSGYLPQHHLQDHRLKQRDDGCYLCSKCGHLVDTRYAVKFISEEEVAERRAKILKVSFKRSR